MYSSDEAGREYTEILGAQALRVLAVAIKRLIAPSDPGPEVLETVLPSWAWWG